MSVIVKPISVVRLTSCAEPPGRVRPLRSLTAGKIAALYFLSGLDQRTEVESRLQLIDYFSALPVTGRLAVFEQIRCELAARSEQSFSLNLRPVGTDVGFLAWAVFGVPDSSLELCEFLSGSGEQIFQYIIREEAEPQEFAHITSLKLGSSDIGGERLSFVYEVTESVWKPELRHLFTVSLTGLTRLSLAHFADDDTLCIVGECCQKLQFLRVQLSPENFNDQQLTDDGFEELAKYQEHWPSLRELDIQECFSSSITSRTVLSLARIETLTSLHTRAFHFSWLDLTLKMNVSRFKPNVWLKALSINFFVDEVESFDAEGLINGHAEAIFARILLSALGDLFPNVDELSVEGIHSDLLHNALDGELSGSRIDPPSAPLLLLASLAPRLVRLRIKKCPLPLLDQLTRHLPRLRALGLTYTLGPVAPRIQPLDQLTELKVTRDEYRDVVHYADLRGLLCAAPHLQKFYLVNASVYVSNGSQRQMMSEEEFLDIFRAAPRLCQSLEVLSLTFSCESQLTGATALALLDLLPRLRLLDNLLSWRISGPEDLGPPDRLAERYGMGLVCASRRHWSLHWRGEDGRYYEPTLPVDRF